jgi:membrane-associated protease RseP (regulator of RpoE activity)
MSSEDYKRVEFQYGLVLLRTRRFQGLMDRLGRNRISKPVGWVLLYLMPVAAAFGLFIFLTNFLVLFSPVAHQVGVAVRGISPLAYLGLPGINPYLPLVDGWISLVFAMIIHEGAHGIVARSLGLPVKAAGLLFFLFVPIGAFVDVDEQAIKSARARDSGRVLAAGAGVNFVIGVVFLLLLFSVVSTMTPATNGIGVTQVATPSPAQSAGIRPGDFIIAVNGIPYNDPTLIPSAGWYRPNQVVNVSIWQSGQVEFKSLTLGVNPDNASLGYMGVENIGYASLKSLASAYTSSLFTRPVLYLCIATFPQCSASVPFSDSRAPFYTSPYGDWLVPTANLLYWLFFLNFNLAIFNALPIYPLDGGQAFRVGLKGLSRGRLSEKTLTTLTTAATLVVILLIVTFPLSAYLGLV